MTQDPNLEKKRYFVLMAIRLSGTVMAVFGAAILAGRLGTSPAAGAPLLVIGAVDALLLPVLLARKWRSGQR